MRKTNENTSLFNNINWKNKRKNKISKSQMKNILTILTT